MEEMLAKLQATAEEMSDYAYERLLAASSRMSAGDTAGEPASKLMAEEKAVTRARRSVEKAVSILESFISVNQDAAGTN
jgi:hypothetical protein